MDKIVCKDGKKYLVTKDEWLFIGNIVEQEVIKNDRQYKIVSFKME